MQINKNLRHLLFSSLLVGGLPAAAGNGECILRPGEILKVGESLVSNEIDYSMRDGHNFATAKFKATVMANGELIITRLDNIGQNQSDGHDGADVVWGGFGPTKVISSSKDRGGLTLATTTTTTATATATPTPTLSNNNGLVRLAVSNTVLWIAYNTPGASLVLKEDGTLVMEGGTGH